MGAVTVYAPGSGIFASIRDLPQGKLSSTCLMFCLYVSNASRPGAVNRFPFLPIEHQPGASDRRAG